MITAQVLNHPNCLRQQEGHFANGHECRWFQDHKNVPKTNKGARCQVQHNMDQIGNRLRVGGELVSEKEVRKPHHIKGDKENGHAVPKHVPLVLDVLQRYAKGANPRVPEAA